MEIKNLESFKKEFDNALDWGTILYADQQGDVYTHTNHLGLLSSGVLDKPHLFFDMSGLKSHVYQAADHFGMSYQKARALVRGTVQDYIKQWDGEESQTCDINHLW
ncbi:hypothetical protein B7C51_24450 [Paenibacillus larvae subsp. pulvifaciens]|uniref:Uncharacterized protein n=1 Tax=Paenibacillus larvae subsp. pulvifaciens TaxID=1477 RepID=A0A1V0UYW4_9BACL|nr:hypothetical protein [Paenibacillus larvae]ARF70319.1 hypothetical protein B7C51_24450 [Paenibacillus larvae subsp. pulvifaciens]